MFTKSVGTNFKRRFTLCIWFGSKKWNKYFGLRCEVHARFAVAEHLNLSFCQFLNGELQQFHE